MTSFSPKSRQIYTSEWCSYSKIECSVVVSCLSPLVWWIWSYQRYGCRRHCISSPLLRRSSASCWQFQSILARQHLLLMFAAIPLLWVYKQTNVETVYDTYVLLHWFSLSMILKLKRCTVPGQSLSNPWVNLSGLLTAHLLCLLLTHMLFLVPPALLPRHAQADR